MSDEQRLNALRKDIGLAGTVAPLLSILGELDGLSHNPVAAPHLRQLVDEVFQKLRQLTTNDSVAAGAIIQEQLVPRALATGDDDPSTGRMLDSILVSWLTELPDGRRQVIHGLVASQTTTAIQQTLSRAALRVAGAVGYWDAGLIAALDGAVALSPDEVGDHALSVRAWLMPDGKAAPALLSALHERMVARRNGYLVTAARNIGDRSSVESVWRNWLVPLASGGGPEADVWLHLVVGVLVAIARRAQMPLLADRIWNWLDAPSTGALGDRAIAIGGGLAPALDTPSVVPGLLRRASVGSDHERYLHYSRLRECVLPAHIGAWPFVGAEQFKGVRADATIQSGSIGVHPTMLLDLKLAAWDVLLSRGDRGLLPDLEDSIRGENSGYVVGELLTLAGALSLRRVPAVAAELLSLERESSWSDSERLAAQVGAIHAVSGMATQEAFDALLEYRALGGRVLASAVSGLAEVAAVIGSGGDRGPIARLLGRAEASLADQRQVAAGAVASLVEKGELFGNDLSRASRLCGAEYTDDLAETELLLAFARSARPVPANVVNHALTIIDRCEPPARAQKYAAALAVAARQSEMTADREFLRSHLGLVEGQSPEVGLHAANGSAPYVLGRFYVNEPARFGAAVSAIVVDGAPSAVAQVLPAIRQLGGQNVPAVSDALLARLIKMDDGRMAEPEVIQGFALANPGLLLAEGCRGIAGWLPHARVSLANTLGSLGQALSKDLDDARFGLLARLAGDGVHAVRRAAYRAAAACAPSQLGSLVQAWAEVPDGEGAGVRRRAAECRGWLPTEVSQSICRLAWDSDPGVRGAFASSVAECSDRVTAAAYEAVVLSVGAPDDVIGNWRYGLALGQVGDDSTVEALTRRLADRLSPSVRAWLLRVRKAVERRWAVETRKWPEPWFSRAGRLESFEGTIQSSEGVRPATGTLWLMQAEAPGGRSSWGGWARTAGVTSLDASTLSIRGRTTRVLLTSVELLTGDVVFVGNGPYPD